MVNAADKLNLDQPFCVVAIDVGGTKIASGLVVYQTRNSAPKVEAYRTVPTNPARGGEAVLRDVVESARTLIECATLPIAGIGADAAGCIDPISGSVLSANEIMPGWAGQPIAGRLHEEFGLAATAMGDVHAHGLGEARWGVAAGKQSALMVAIGTGIGGAYILDGRVVRGFHGTAGHLGCSLHHEARDIRCTCGTTGHVEAITSGTAISAMYQERDITDELDPSLMGDTVSLRASAGEKRAVEVLRFAGRSLGEAIGSWCNILDPECIVLSGTVTKAGPLWRDALMEGRASQALGPVSQTPIIDGVLGGNAPLIGAAENLLDALE